MPRPNKKAADTSPLRTDTKGKKVEKGKKTKKTKETSRLKPSPLNPLYVLDLDSPSDFISLQTTGQSPDIDPISPRIKSSLFKGSRASSYSKQKTSKHKKPPAVEGDACELVMGTTVAAEPTSEGKRPSDTPIQHGPTKKTKTAAPAEGECKTPSVDNAPVRRSQRVRDRSGVEWPTGQPQRARKEAGRKATKEAKKAPEERQNAQEALMDLPGALFGDHKGLLKKGYWSLDDEVSLQNSSEVDAALEESLNLFGEIYLWRYFEQEYHASFHDLFRYGLRVEKSPGVAGSMADISLNDYLKLVEICRHPVFKNRIDLLRYALQYAIYLRVPGHIPPHRPPYTHGRSRFDQQQMDLAAESSKQEARHVLAELAEWRSKLGIYENPLLLQLTSILGQRRQPVWTMPGDDAWPSHFTTANTLFLLNTEDLDELGTAISILDRDYQPMPTWGDELSTDQALHDHLQRKRRALLAERREAMIRRRIKERGEDHYLLDIAPADPDPNFLGWPFVFRVDWLVLTGQIDDEVLTTVHTPLEYQQRYEEMSLMLQRGSLSEAEAGRRGKPWCACRTCIGLDESSSSEEGSSFTESSFDSSSEDLSPRSSSEDHSPEGSPPDDLSA